MLRTIESDLSNDDGALGPNEAAGWIAVLHAIRTFLERLETNTAADQEMTVDEAALESLAQLESSPRFKWTARLSSLQRHLTQLEGAAAGQSGAICELLAALAPLETDVTGGSSQVAASIEE